MNIEKIIIVDFGGSLSQNIASEIRKKKVYCEIFPYYNAKENLDDYTKAVILAGVPSEKAKNEVDSFKNLDIPTYDEIGNREIDIEKIIEENNFSRNWTMESYKDKAIEDIKNQVGDGKVLLALSGGVDSSVCASLISEAVGDRLTAIFVDTGLMRKNEGKEVEEAFKDFGMNFVYVDAEDRFLEKLKGVTDPEKKRKIIGEEFIRVFEDEAKKIGHVEFLAQGTIYPDIIESGDSEDTVIKSHHNVGGLPDVIDFEGLIEPLKYLFKFEDRELGRLLGLSDKLVDRQPFPGPGLSVRCIGEVRKDRLDILRDADYIYREEIAKAGLDKNIDQYFAVLTNTLSTGNRDNKRTYDYTVALRAVETKDFMSGKAAEIPFEVLKKASKRITDEVEHVNRVVYDITDKPPATIEWE